MLNTGTEEDDHEARQRRCVALSRRLGAAVYWYGSDLGDDWTSWCLADNGTLVRYYYHDFNVGEVEVGAPLLAEAGLHALTGACLFGVLDKYAPPDVTREFIPRDVRHASVIARRTSVDLVALGPGTQVVGHGVLALTACGRIDGHRGAFPL